MGLLSIGRSSESADTTTTTRIDNEANTSSAGDNSIIVQKDAVANMLDGGAISAAFAFANESFQKSINSLARGYSESVAAVTTMGQDSMAEVSGAYATSTGKANAESLTKIVVTGAVIALVAWSIFKR
jgi:hypothetical protein